MQKLEDEAHRALQALLWNRGGKPDARPLYKYRFNIDEFERAGNLFRKGGTGPLRSKEGQALLLLFLAEWFRRERTSGAWGWEQPLLAAGLTYRPHQHTLNAREINYAKLRDTLLEALRWWKRPAPKSHHTKKYLWAVVSEAGFPLAAVSSETGLKRWIQHAVAQMFQGVPANVAVAAQSYRFNVEDLRTGLQPIAVELVEALFDLKRFVLKGGASARVDAISYLDQFRSDWREDLPLDVSGDEIRALVEETLLAPTSQDKTLDARRILRQKNGRWDQAIRIELSGSLPDFYFQQLAETLEGAARARIYLRGDMIESLSRPIAVLEKSKRDGTESWECRPLSSATSFGTALLSDITLVVQVGDRPPALIAPRGSAPITDQAIALTAPVGGDTIETRTQLEFAPPGSFDTPGGQLYLLCEKGVEKELQFSEEGSHSHVTEIGDTHALKRFTGITRLTEDGVELIWRTNCEQAAAQELTCLGTQVQGAIPPVFIGVPEIQSEDSETRLSIPLDRLHWRPIGKRQWAPASASSVTGEGDLAIISEGRLVARTRIRAVEKYTQFKFSNASNCRQLKILNCAAGECRAWAGETELEVDLDKHGWLLDLDKVRPGSMLKIELKWEETRLTVRIRDGSVEKCISSSTGGPSEARPRIDLSTMSSLSIWAKTPQRLIFEARGDGARFDCIRTIAGETSLAVFRREVQELFGLFDSQDTRIRLNWLGDGGWSAEIARYTLDQAKNIDWAFPVEQIRNSFRALDAKSLVVVPVCHPNNACLIDVDDLASTESFRTYLAKLSAEGPWIIAGRQAHGGAIKPFFIDAGVQTLTSSELERALLLPATTQRKEALVELGAKTSGRELLAQYVAASAKIARRYSISASGFDGLTLLAEHPALAVSLLANTNDPEGIEAVLDLERDLPFLWALTKTSDWARAFCERADSLSRKLSLAGVDDPSTPIRATTKVLEQICSTMPELSVHASWAALALAKAYPASAAKEIKPYLSPFEERVQSLLKTDVRRVRNEMVLRRVDGLPPPNLSFSGTGFTPTQSGFDPKFDGVLSAPDLVAKCATGACETSAQIVRICKQARLYDDGYFLQACPTAVFQALMSPKQVELT